MQLGPWKKEVQECGSSQVASLLVQISASALTARDPHQKKIRKTAVQSCSAFCWHFIFVRRGSLPLKVGNFRWAGCLPFCKKLAWPAQKSAVLCTRHRTQQIHKIELLQTSNLTPLPSLMLPGLCLNENFQHSGL